MQFGTKVAKSENEKSNVNLRILTNFKRKLYIALSQNTNLDTYFITDCGWSSAPQDKLKTYKQVLVGFFDYCVKLIKGNLPENKRIKAIKIGYPEKENSTISDKYQAIIKETFLEALYQNGLPNVQIYFEKESILASHLVLRRYIPNTYSNIAVLDIGGSTTDLAYLKKDSNGFNFTKIDGKETCSYDYGGSYIDDVLYETFYIKYNGILPNKTLLDNKKKLVDNEGITLTSGQKLTYRAFRTTYLGRELSYQGFVKFLEQHLKNKGLQTLILTGASSKFDTMKNRINKILNGNSKVRIKTKIIYIDDEKEIQIDNLTTSTAVAFGAAQQLFEESQKLIDITKIKESIINGTKIERNIEKQNDVYLKNAYFFVNDNNDARRGDIVRTTSNQYYFVTINFTGAFQLERLSNGQYKVISELIKF